MMAKWFNLIFSALNFCIVYALPTNNWQIVNVFAGVFLLGLAIFGAIIDAKYK